MNEIELRIDEPEEIETAISGMTIGTSLVIEIPVLVSAQDSEDIAISIFEATFICDVLAPGLANPTLAFGDDPQNPNAEIVTLSGQVVNPSVMSAFFGEWDATLDPNGDGEPFVASNEGEHLLQRLRGDDEPRSFRWPELVEWFRRVH